MRTDLTLGQYLDTLVNNDKLIKKLSNPSGKFQYVCFVNTNDNKTHTYFTNNVQFLQSEFKSFKCEKKYTVWQVAEYIAKNQIKKEGM